MKFPLNLNYDGKIVCEMSPWKVLWKRMISPYTFTMKSVSRPRMFWWEFFIWPHYKCLKYKCSYCHQFLSLNFQSCGLLRLKCSRAMCPLRIWVALAKVPSGHMPLQGVISGKSLVTDVTHIAANVEVDFPLMLVEMGSLRVATNAEWALVRARSL